METRIGLQRTVAVFVIGVGIIRSDIEIIDHFTAHSFDVGIPLSNAKSPQSLDIL
ncbi:MAG: hypothetical protein ACYS80_15995 [Planctomycetota bacterium]|jgi:hypothetical protein